MRDLFRTIIDFLNLLNIFHSNIPYEASWRNSSSSPGKIPLLELVYILSLLYFSLYTII